MITGEFRQAILELEKACIAANFGLQKVSDEAISIMTANGFTDRYNSCYFEYPTINVMEHVIDALSERIRNATAYSKKRDEIVNKFDAAIKAAKASRSAARLKELADALGIETPSIEVDTSVKAQIDTEFVKEKIKSVLMLN